MKAVLITGTSRGIGLALAKIFLDNDFMVIGACRTEDTENFDHKNFRTFPLDLSNEDSILEFTKIIKEQKIQLDIIINNAGIGPDLNFTYPEEKSFKQTFDVNVMGTTFFTEQMVNHLNDGSKIIIISSKMGSIGLCTLTDSVAYRMSKTALNMYTKILSNRFLNTHTVASIHPGWVRTTISKTNVNGRLSPEESAIRIYNFILSDFRTGIFWDIETHTECEW